MNVQMHPSQLASLVNRLNFEIQEQIIDRLNAIKGTDCVIGWSQPGEEHRLDIRSDTKMVEVRSIVVPVNVIDSTCLSIPLDGARLEIGGAWRIDSDHYWLRNYCFGVAGTLVLTLPSFEPDHINAAAVTLAATISKYLDAEIETC